jgi:hypothetical protein
MSTIVTSNSCMQAWREIVINKYNHVVLIKVKEIDQEVISVIVYLFRHIIP